MRPEDLGDELSSMERLATVACSNHSPNATEESHEKYRITESRSLAETYCSRMQIELHSTRFKTTFGLHIVLTEEFRFVFLYLPKPMLANCLEIGHDRFLPTSSWQRFNLLLHDITSAVAGTLLNKLMFYCYGSGKLTF